MHDHQQSLLLRWRHIAEVLIATGLFLTVPQSPNAQEFTPACTNPSLPGKQTGIDQQCGIEGAGGKEAEQDAVKNNFCASGTPTVLNFARFQELQSAVEQIESINFGDP